MKTKKEAIEEFRKEFTTKHFVDDFVGEINVLTVGYPDALEQFISRVWDQAERVGGEEGSANTFRKIVNDRYEIRKELLYDLQRMMVNVIKDTKKQELTQSGEVGE